MSVDKKISEQTKPFHRKPASSDDSGSLAAVRDVAARAYAHWLRKPGRIDHALQWMFEHSKWTPRDRSLLQELIYGVIRWHGRIEWMLDRLTARSLPTDKLVYAATAIGAYQILYLDRIPAYAAVDEAVRISRTTGGKAASGWTNAILRKLASDPDHWRNTYPQSKNPAYSFSIRYSHPEWMVERWLKNNSIDEIEKFLVWNNRRPSVTIRANSLQTTLTEFTRTLQFQGVSFTPAGLDPHFFALEFNGEPNGLEVIHSGQASAQDVSHGLVAPIVAPKPDEHILDLCSAPGGKTGHLAELCSTAHIVATDLSQDRLKTVSENVQRCRYTNILIEPYEAVLQKSQPLYDAVLVDAPCTGTGVLARRPDLRWRRTLKDVTHMAATQLQLLRYASERVKRGGRIVYSTCSIEPEENIMAIETFLQGNSSFKLVPLTGRLPDNVVDKNGCLNLKGNEFGGDGVFAAYLERKV